MHAEYGICHNLLSSVLALHHCKPERLQLDQTENDIWKSKYVNTDMNLFSPHVVI